MRTCFLKKSLGAVSLHLHHIPPHQCSGILCYWEIRATIWQHSERLYASKHIVKSVLFVVFKPSISDGHPDFKIMASVRPDASCIIHHALLPP